MVDMKRAMVLCGLILVAVLRMDAQENKTFREQYEEFRRQATGEYESFRQKCNEEYAEFMRKAWKEFEMGPAIPKPKEKPVPPVVLPIEDREQPIESHPIPFDGVMPVPVVVPQPQPIEPVTPQPIQVEKPCRVEFFGTELGVSLTEDELFRLSACHDDAISDMWKVLADGRFEGVLGECLDIRQERHLCDWAYLLMLQQIADSFLGEGSNEAVLLTAFLYCQSGYKVRIARQDGRLCLLYATDNRIYDTPSWTVDGESFYPLGDMRGRVFICAAPFPQETSLSLAIPDMPVLQGAFSNERELVSERFPEMKVTAITNRNLLDFYDTYPTSMINEDFGTRWAFYANVPASDEVREVLYPQLRELIAGKSQWEAGNLLLNWVQTAFVYEYDDKVWGEDRAFFPDETLYYPYCDCEDRSILFSRLVRDLMGLEVILLYYPGHLATAVCFTEDVAGDYLLVNGKRYVVCDPTFINANVGRTMTDMDNATAHVILLE